MNAPSVLAPQIIVDSEVIYLTWEAKDQDFARSLVPAGFKIREPGIVYMNQYRVTNPLQHSNAEHPSSWGAYDITYLGVDLEGHDLHDGTPCRFWTHYYNSSPNMVDYALRQGIPAQAGNTELTIAKKTCTAISRIGGKPAIRTDVRFSEELGDTMTGQLRYLVKKSGQFEAGQYPFVIKPQADFSVEALAFPDPESPVYGLRPKSKTDIASGFFSRSVTFAYPGGVQPNPPSSHSI